MVFVSSSSAKRRLPDKPDVRVPLALVENTNPTGSDGFPMLIPSQEVLENRGKTIVRHTEKGTKTGMNSWASIQLKDLLSPEAPIQSKKEEWIMSRLKERVMPDATEYMPLSIASQKNLNISLSEFVQHYRKANGERVSPSTLLTYLEGINRWLQKTWLLKVDIMYDQIFRDNDTGYLTVADRIAARQQAAGIRIQPYNAMTDNDVKKILHHDVTSPKTATGYVNRTIVVVGLLLGLRPEALRKLSWFMFTDELDFHGKPCLRYQGIIGSFEGDSKTDKGGLKKAKKLPTSIVIFDEDLEYDFNPYKYIVNHRNLCFATGNKKDFFLSANTHKFAKSLLKNSPIGQSQFKKHWKNIYTEAEVRGVGPYDHPVLHSLRKTLINNLMRAKFTDAQITLRTGHASVQSVQPYANIAGEAGEMQQQSIFKQPEAPMASPSKRRRTEGKETEIHKAVEAAINSLVNNGNLTINVNIVEK